MKSLIVGMGIGQLYFSVLQGMEHEIITVDANPEKNADFTTVEDALQVHRGSKFDTAHICTPNYTHEQLARQIAPFCRIVFVEKPGVVSEAAWRDLVQSFPETRFMMVKNNMWRDNIDTLRALATQASKVELCWINANRVPNPGTWFTTKKLAYGGVSRDLLPHLLSLYAALSPKFTTATETYRKASRAWSLDEVTNTDYGTVNPNGVYDVDDICQLHLFSDGRKWEITANWKSDLRDQRQIVFTIGGVKVTEELGLCPESAYRTMIECALGCIDYDPFWKEQLELDCWIHSKIEEI